MIGLSVLSLIITVALPFTPFAGQLGFVVPPFEMLGIIAGILILYVVTGDIIKVIFFKRMSI
jgi:Mg2+-importing ATPase